MKSHPVRPLADARIALLRRQIEDAFDRRDQERMMACSRQMDQAQLRLWALEQPERAPLAEERLHPIQ